MNDITKKNEVKDRADPIQKAEKKPYAAPGVHVAGSAVDLVQGCGGSSGTDVSSYRIHC